jgi:arylesterase / paraoxonase
MRQVKLLLRTPTTSVGYCHIEEGCKLATPKIHDANGIASVNDTFFVANSLKGSITVLERQTDNSLVLTDVISTGKLIRYFRCDKTSKALV